jgi:hypothetical protein
MLAAYQTLLLVIYDFSQLINLDSGSISLNVLLPIMCEVKPTNLCYELNSMSLLTL